MLDQISKFVDQMRVQADTVGTTPTTPRGCKPSAFQGHGENVGSPVDQVVVEAEQFKAAVEKPQGIISDDIFQSSEIRHILQKLMDNDDDEFFHLTCHIELSLKQKIQRGEFVELERLLPKSRAQVVNEEQKMHFVNRDGATYWVCQIKKVRSVG